MHYRYILAFGSNLGDRVSNLRQGLLYLSKNAKLLMCSQWEVTEPLTSERYVTTNHEFYVNFVCDIISALPPQDLYNKIYEIENKIGHSRAGKWLPRSLDIDIIFAAMHTDKDFSQCPPLVFENKEGLKIPHSAYFERNFWRHFIEDDLHISKKSIIKHFQTPSYI